MVRSSTPGNLQAPCMVVDMGAFNLVEFVRTLGIPAPGLSVTGGVHVLQILSHSLATRATMFAPLDATNKVDSCCHDMQIAASACNLLQSLHCTLSSTFSVSTPVIARKKAISY